MLRRHLDVPVYSDSIAPLRCSHCNKVMDSRGDHATHCRNGFGITHRHNTLRSELANSAFRAARYACALKVPFLIQNTEHRPADILVQPGPPPPRMPPDKPTAYDVTIRSPYDTNLICLSAQRSAAAAEAADIAKRQAIHRTLRSALHLSSDAPIPAMDWHFVRIAFDTLGA